MQSSLNSRAPDFEPRTISSKREEGTKVIRLGILKNAAESYVRLLGHFVFRTVKVEVLKQCRFVLERERLENNHVFG